MTDSSAAHAFNKVSFSILLQAFLDEEIHDSGRERELVTYSKNNIHIRIRLKDKALIVNACSPQSSLTGTIQKLIRMEIRSAPNVTRFGLVGSARFRLDPPPFLSSRILCSGDVNPSLIHSRRRRLEGRVFSASSSYSNLVTEPMQVRRQYWEVARTAAFFA